MEERMYEVGTNSYIQSSSSSPFFVYPSCLQTTAASFASHSSSHTEPQRPCRHTSTLPSNSLAPSIRRTSPLVQLAFSAEGISCYSHVLTTPPPHTHTHTHTWADNASILEVPTVGGGIVGTVHKSALIPCALHIVQEDGPLPLAKECPPHSNSICKIQVSSIEGTNVTASALWTMVRVSHTDGARALLGNMLHLLSVLNPSCRHATAASVLSQKSSHTVPAQRLFWQTSSVPSLSAVPPTKRISPS